MDAEGSGGGLPDASSITKKRYLIDTVYMKHPVKDMELSTFLKDGMGEPLILHSLIVLWLYWLIYDLDRPVIHSDFTQNLSDFRGKLP